jgi:xanthine dehydrogenase YagR molybdenum-binding subunit
MPEINNPQPSVIGAALPRIDGPAKTTGTALYSADYHFPGLLYAVPVPATIASGRIRSIDTSRAENMPGVVRVLHRANAGQLYRPVPDDPNIRVDERRPPFEDDVVYYAGQYVAAAIAKTLEQAQAAADTVRVDYDPAKPELEPNLFAAANELKVAHLRGDVEAAFRGAPVQFDATYVTPVETHNPIEMHATVAVWEGNNVTLYETTQSLVNHRAAMAQILGIPKENVRIVMRYLGSGFGGKLWPWPQAAVAAVAARQLNRPVKFVLSRRMMFTCAGHRPRTEQTVRLGATPEGKLISLEHDYANHTSMVGQYGENCGEATPFFYSCPNLRIRSAIVKHNVGTPTPMRGPGAVPGLFAIESAIDELAIKLKMDPVEFRLKNEPAHDESNGLPFSSRHSRECMELGAQKIGWSKRTPAVGSMRRGDLIYGLGVAACTWPAQRQPCEVAVELTQDGTARVSCATQDIGTGTYTIFAQIVSGRTGVPLNKVQVVLGDSRLPPGPLSGGSMVTGTVVPALVKACDAAAKNLFKIAVRTPGTPFHDKKPELLALTRGRIHERDQAASSGVPFTEILKSAHIQGAAGEGKSPSSKEDPKTQKVSLHSWGAQFAEVTWDPGIARLRVSRVVSVIDVGRVINQKTARNQVEGAIMMGIGMAMLEHTVYDRRNARPVNDNLADYLVATCPDTPEIDVTFLDYPDPVLNEYGARGVGEIGLAGVAPAITAAVYQATGVRVRELPVRIEDLLHSTVV